MTSETERLTRANRRLSIALAGVLALAVVGAASGMGAQPGGTNHTSLASDGKYLYRMRENGTIDRISIAALEAIDPQHRTKSGQWERFTR